MNGILNILKPEGITSYGVIREVKRVTGEKKIGHTGTLDPLAKGVLPLFIGKLTKLIPHFNLDDKEYEVTAVLGQRSDTLDREGIMEPVPIPDDCHPDLVRARLNGFVGEISQVPPMYSAVKVKGKKLYQYARKGEDVERSPRMITIHTIDQISISMPEIRFKTRCSKGTYIRSLVRDLGESLGTAAVMTALTRTKSGDIFTLKNAESLDRVIKLNKSDLQKIFIDPQYLLPDWHVVTAGSEQICQYISQGRAIKVPPGDILVSRKGESEHHTLVKNGLNQTIAAGRLEFSQDGPAMFHPSSVFIGRL